MANKLTRANLIEEMLIKLETFNRKGIILGGETVHDEVLSTDFPGAPPSRKLYSGAMQWTILANGGKKVKFPSNWLTYTVDDLAEFIMSKQ